MISFAEGLLYGILEEAFPGDLAHCIGDTSEIEVHLEKAINDFKIETFDSIKSGIKEIGIIVQAIPSLLKDCKIEENDLKKLAEMAVIFTHPLTLALRVGKNILVNGVDIYDKISKGLTLYQSADYNGSGRQFGMALAEVFLKTSS